MKAGRNDPKVEMTRNGPLTGGPDKTAWEYYNDNMRIIEADREKEWEENMNTILIVASLLAALVAAFLIETTKLLQEDPNDIVKAAIIHLSAQYNNSAIGRFETPPFKATAENIVLNTLLLISLALNLVAAVVAMLVKQWNREFDRGLRLITDPKSQALMREFRMLGLDAWHLSDIVNFVPILVLLSVFFILGIFLYLLSLHQIPSWTFLTVSGATVLIYIITVLISITNCQSPFRSAVSRVGYYLYVRLRARISPKPNSWESEDDSTLIEVNEKREQSHANRDTMIMAIFQRLSNITEIAPRNWHRFYSIAQQLVSDSVDGGKTSLTRHQNWPNLLHKIDMGLAGNDGRGLLFLAAEKSDENMLRLLKEILLVRATDKRGFSPLHVAAQEGSDITWILKHLKDIDIDAENVYGQTPLSLAATNGHTEVVRQLLSQDRVNVNSRDHNNGRSPLSSASLNGHKPVVRILLNQEGIDVNFRDNAGRTPLFLAIQGGHTEIVQLILEKEGVNPSVTDEEGRSPLSLVLTDGQNAIAWMILKKKGAEFEEDEDQDSYQPLFWAAKAGNTEVMQLMIAKERSNINTTDSTGQTPLSLAASHGHEAVIKMILEVPSVDVSAKDDLGRTPLSLSVSNKHDEAVDLLLSHPSLNVNMCCDGDGQKPLLIAAKNGNYSTVQMLLAKDGIDADATDPHGRTALSWAAENGHEQVVRLLLAEQSVDIDAEDHNGRTPLSWVNLNKYPAIFWMILQKKGIKTPAYVDWDGEVPLLWAAMKGVTAAVNQLLVRQDVDVNVKDYHGRTPLLWATYYGYEKVVELLLARPDVDVNAKDRDNRTALSYAIYGGYDRVVKILLAIKDVELHYKDDRGYTPLQLAVQREDHIMLRLLLERHDLDVNTEDSDGNTPLLWAIKERKIWAIMLLGARREANIDFKGRGQVLLFWAAQEGLEGILRLVWTTRHLDPNIQDDNGRTMLSWAAANGHDGVVEMLMTLPYMDSNIADKEGKIPLSWAVENGHHSVVQKLVARQNAEKRGYIT